MRRRLKDWNTRRPWSEALNFGNVTSSLRVFLSEDGGKLRNIIPQILKALQRRAS